MSVPREPQKPYIPTEPAWDWHGYDPMFEPRIEPNGHMEKITLRERNELAKGRIRIRAGGIRFIGGKTWSQEFNDAGLDRDRRKIPPDDRNSKRPHEWRGVDLDDLDKTPIEIDPMYTDGRFGSQPTLVEGVLINQPPKPVTIRKILSEQG